MKQYLSDTLHGVKYHKIVILILRLMLRKTGHDDVNRLKYLMLESSDVNTALKTGVS